MHFQARVLLVTHALAACRTLQYNDRHEYYVGLYWTPRVDMEWREVHIAYASGGAGYALSHALMRRLRPVMPMCQTNFTRWAGDVRVGKCINDLNVRVTPAVGFHHEGAFVFCLPATLFWDG